MSSAEIAQTVKTLFSPGDVVELRMFKDGAIYSGYFDDHAKLVKAAEKYGGKGYEIYVTLNRLKKELLFRRANRVERAKRGEGTTDRDIVRRDWLFVDADPERPSGISSTDAEKEQGRFRILEIRDFLRERGWGDGILCDSGNGYHLLQPIDLPNDDESLALIGGVLEALHHKFTDEVVKVDRTTKNAARIDKFYGVTAKKGENHPDRPHRQSKILEVTEDITPVAPELLAEVAALKPAQERPSSNGSHFSGTMDGQEWVENFIAKHNIPIRREGPWNSNGYSWEIDEPWPWNGHTDTSYWIGVRDTGQIVGGCHHDSCSDYSWDDVREHYEPGSKERKARFAAGNDSNDSNDNDDNNDNDSKDSFYRMPRYLEFPLEVLPPSARQFAREAARSIGCPVGFVASSMFATFSAAVGDTRRILLKKGWEESGAVDIVLIGPASSKKTPAFNAGIRPAVTRHVKKERAYQRAMKNHKRKMAEWTKEGKKNGDPEPEKPVQERTFTSDTTVERMAGLLNENRRGVLLARDELSGWLRSMDQYKGGKGSDRQFWLSVWSNVAAPVDRKDEESTFFLPRPYAPILGGIQPDVLPEFGHERGDGLVERFLPCYPEPMFVRWSYDEISDEASEAYAEVVEELYRLKFIRSFDEDGEEVLDPRTVEMTKDAKDLWIVAYNTHIAESEAPSFPVRLGTVWGKLEAYTARLSLILAMVRIAELGIKGEEPEERVERSDVEGALELVRYFKNQVHRTYSKLYGENLTDLLAEDFEDFMRKNDGVWEGSAKELHEAFVSEHKPKRENELSKYVRQLCQRVPSLELVDLKRTAKARRFRISLESLSSSSSLSSLSSLSHEEDEVFANEDEVFDMARSEPLLDDEEEL